MGSEQGPEFYDSRLERVCVPLEENPWRDLYEMAASLLPPPETYPRIADIGCGTGRFAKLLQQKGYTEYWGVDFSPARIREARRYVPEFDFSVGDIFDKSVQERFKYFNVFALLEVLEHIENDLELLASVPSGSRVIFSVPNYDSAAHVRFFRDTGTIIDRYGKMVVFSKDSNFVIPCKKQGKFIFLFGCVKS